MSYIAVILTVER